jgi:hypothetical protein
MSRFLDHLQLELLWDANGDPLKSRDGKQLYKVLSDFRYESTIARCVVTVRAGFITDLASVPRLPLVYLFLGDMAQEEAVVHDCCYRYKLFPRDICDKILLEAMELRHISWAKRRAIYSGVRIGGASHYGKD